MVRRQVAQPLRVLAVPEAGVAMLVVSVQGQQVHLGKVAQVGMVTIIAILILVAVVVVVLLQQVQTVRVTTAVLVVRVAQPQ